MSAPSSEKRACAFCIAVMLTCLASACSISTPKTPSSDASACQARDADARSCVADAAVPDTDACRRCDATVGDDAACVADACVADASVPESTCEVLCRYDANCGKTCDYIEDPLCDEQKNFEFAYAACTKDCEAGVQTREAECRSAAHRYEQCVSERACSGADWDACESDRRRYTEQCVLHPGAFVCPALCAELESGCTPYSAFDLRAPTCLAQCEQAAQQVPCIEALYAYDECTPGARYGCKPVTKNCDASAEGVRSQCSSLHSVSVSKEDTAFCTRVGQEQCRCGLWPTDICDRRITQRCLFALTFGKACRDATAAFDACMQSLDVCSRDLLLEKCRPQWDAYTEHCS